jgi:hypothetical protein
MAYVYIYLSMYVANWTSLGFVALGTLTMAYVYIYLNLYVAIEPL